MIECAEKEATPTTAQPRHSHPGFVRAVDLALAGDDEAALASVRRAVDADPDDYRARGFAAALLGRLGRWAEFWPACECRRQGPRAQPNVFADWPEWRGEPLDGRTIVVWLEQGDGDCILFARYLPELRRRGAGRVIVFPHRHGLERLLAAVPGVDHVGAVDVMDFCQCPIASLPLRLGMMEPTWPGPYLSGAVSPRRFDLSGDGLRVGVRWAGSPLFPEDHLRSRRLAEFAPLAGVPGVTLYALQKGHGSEQVAAAPFPIVDRMGECDDYADTAALIAGLDLVVTTCTSVAHLAAAMGKPTWVLLSEHASFWAWGRAGDSTPWYPTVRVFRGTGRAVIDRVADELRAVASATTSEVSQ